MLSTTRRFSALIRGATSVTLAAALALPGIAAADGGKHVALVVGVGEYAHLPAELHLEHAAAEVIERDGELVPSGEPEPRWWFTSRIPALEAAVEAAFAGQDCDYTQIIHPGAPHGYAIPDRDAYDKQATYRDWEYIYAMYDRMLRGR